MVASDAALTRLEEERAALVKKPGCRSIKPPGNAQLLSMPMPTTSQWSSPRRLTTYAWPMSSHGVPGKPHLARAVHHVLNPGGLIAIVNWYARPREKAPVLGESRGPTTALRNTGGPAQLIGLRPKQASSQTKHTKMHLRAVDSSLWFFCPLLHVRLCP